ncbi:uncharacterized protein [Arachis hypogaea]|uniref:uncharacterized protein n=1 Tax=Arachis hypogaea TaxID=3818 RepID=UPI003B2237FB|nr:uncharacterized protein DS421_3g74120 [Arachis hypogaea]
MRIWSKDVIRICVMKCLVQLKLSCAYIGDSYRHVYQNGGLQIGSSQVFAQSKSLKVCIREVIRVKHLEHVRFNKYSLKHLVRATLLLVAYFEYWTILVWLHKMLHCCYIS